MRKSCDFLYIRKAISLFLKMSGIANGCFYCFLKVNVCPSLFFRTNLVEVNSQIWNQKTPPLSSCSIYAPLGGLTDFILVKRSRGIVCQIKQVLVDVLVFESLSKLSIRVMNV